MTEVGTRSSNVEGDDMTKAASKGGKDEAPVRKVICRYGSGCTHLLDPAHREKFWHPKAQRLEGKSRC